MSFSYVVSIALVSFLVMSCSRQDKPEPVGKHAQAPEHEPASPSRVVGLEEGWELAPGGATFNATQKGGQVVITAVGEHPSSNYEAKLVQSMLRIWPPQYMLARKQTGELGAAVMTPFAVTASFNASDPVARVIVTDADGRHEVNVDQSGQ